VKVFRISKITGANGISYRSVFLWLLSATAILGMTACFSASRQAGSTPSSNTSSSSAAGIGGLPQPCSLVTQAEVETALGKGATMTGIFNSRIGMDECILKPASAGAIEEVLIIVHKADLWDGIKKAMLPPSSDAKVVPGLGEDAFVGRAVGYNVRKGRKYIQVFGALTNNDAANEKATRYLAERAISHL
jgi:hypothetical protein